MTAFAPPTTGPRQIPTDLRPDGPWCQRWRHGQHSWRHRSEGGFDAARYAVGALAHAPAKAFVLDHHYSGTWCNDRLRYGLFDLTVGQADCPPQRWVEGAALVGVAVLGVPAQPRVLTNVFPELAPYYETLELSRLVLLDEVPANAETWALARAFRLAADTGLRGVVSFSDPMPRDRLVRDPGTGDTRLVRVSPGHTGTVYQAGPMGGAVYTGTSTPQRAWRVRATGEILNSRALEKVPAGDVGAAAVQRRLVALGARAPRDGEDPRVWLREACAAVADRVVAPGKHRYAFRVARSSAERTRVTMALPALPYPKRHAD